MRIDVKSEQRKFWEIFDEKLIENGEPFSILYEKGGEVTYWAVVNKKQSFVDKELIPQGLKNMILQNCAFK